MLARPYRVLVLYWFWHKGMRPAVRHHLQALKASDRLHDVVYHNAIDPIPESLMNRDYDAILIHNTFLCMRWAGNFLAFERRWRWIREMPCLKVAIPQDEYDHSEILDEWMWRMGVSVICSNFDDRCRPLFYPIMHKRANFYRLHTGYIDNATAEQVAPTLMPVAERPLDIVYRACHLPYWFGSHGQLKSVIATKVASRARDLGLRVDISTRSEDTITSDDWFSFLASAKTIIGVESGSSVLDRRGQIQAYLKELLCDTPTLTFADASKRMPPGWDDYRFFAIGPRHLEAVFTKTCQVLIEGEYDGILLPNRHYLPLRRDFSNLDEVLHKIEDGKLIQSIVDRAYDDLYLSGKYNYTLMACTLESAIDTHRYVGWSRWVRRLKRKVLVAAREAALSSPIRWVRTGWSYVTQPVRDSWSYSTNVLIPVAYKAKWLLEELFRSKVLRAVVANRDAPRRLVFRDLDRLLAMRIIHRDCSSDKFRWTLRPIYNRQRKELLLTSVRVCPQDSSEQVVAPVLAELVDAPLETIQWDHSALGAEYSCRVRFGCTVNFRLPGNVHQFSSLAALASANPQFLANLIDELETESSCR